MVERKIAADSIRSCMNALGDVADVVPDEEAVGAEVHHAGSEEQNLVVQASREVEEGQGLGPEMPAHLERCLISALVAGMALTILPAPVSGSLRYFWPRWVVLLRRSLGLSVGN